MSRIVYLFPDTNLFLQCKSLEQIDWGIWKEFDEVHLMLSRPIQTEIDNLKGRGTERLSKRARKVSSLLRDFIIGATPYLEIRTSNPIVRLFLCPTFKVSKTLSNDLDYTRNDDQLVGIAFGFLEQNSLSDVRVLTHDTGPMASAQAVGLKIAPIPDSWLMPPESSESDKRIRALQDEIKLLREAEPEFEIVGYDSEENKSEKLEFEYKYYEPLTDKEKEFYVQELEKRFPCVTDFGPSEPVEEVGNKIAGLAYKRVYQPVKDSEIDRYKISYGEWLKKCRKNLDKLYYSLNSESYPQLAFVAKNIGLRPANKVLVTLRAQGQFLIMPLPYKDEENEEDEKEKIALERAPRAPKGTWKELSPFSLGGFENLLGLQSELARLSGNADGPSDYLRSAYNLRMPTLPPPHDPNEFYFKPSRPTLPQSSFQYECDQWRHGMGKESFTLQIHPNNKLESVSGVVECQIHCENLSEIASATVPVRISVRRLHMGDTIEKLMQNL